MSRRIHPRFPCLIGTARRSWRTDEGPAPEPLTLWAQSVLAAAADTGVNPGEVLDQVEELAVVHCMSWQYDRPTQRLADRLNIHPGRQETSVLAGTAPQRLLDEAALRILQGSVDVAVVVGGEALATRARQIEEHGRLPDWSFPVQAQADLPVDLEEWHLPTELAHGVVPAFVTFALMEQARWADRGGVRAGRAQLVDVLDRLNDRASRTPDAWAGTRRSGEELLRPSPSNRLVAYPYTKRSTAFPLVDMAAANVLVAHEQADRWGVPMDRRLYLRGWGFARDAVHVAARRDLGGSSAISAATTQALQMAGLTLADVDVFDLYSCFGSAVQFAQDALPLDPGDPRPITVTGGLPFYGGPGSNYMSHSISHALEGARSGVASTYMLTGVGMHMTKHVAAVWSTEPGPLAVPLTDGPQCYTPPQQPPPPVAPHADGPARVRAATSVHLDADAAPFVLAVCELPTGQRCYARSDSPALVDMVEHDEWVGQRAEVRSNGAVNELLV
ncbi:MAG: acetyl-CoA synthetase [Actinomycetes bacterium]